MAARSIRVVALSPPLIRRQAGFAAYVIMQLLPEPELDSPRAWSSTPRSSERSVGRGDRVVS